MNRLTNNICNDYQVIDEKGDFILGENCVFKNCINKLGKLEDIEDELGCDLITLFKALEEGFYVKKDSINEGFISLVKAKDIREVDMITKSITFCDYEFVYFKDYGKTWALIREELGVE